MMIDVDGYAQRILHDFIYYASAYPARMASAMWYCEDSFSFGVRCLKNAFDDAMAGQSGRGASNFAQDTRR